MNMLEKDFEPDTPADLVYLDGEFEVKRNGTYVVCAVSGVHIPMAALRYWSAELQEPYATASIALKRMREKGLTP